MQLGHAVSRNERRRRESLSGVQRSPDHLDLVPTREFGGRVDRLGGVTLRIAHDELELPSVDAAGVVDLLNSQLRTRG